MDAGMDAGAQKLFLRRASLAALLMCAFGAFMATGVLGCPFARTFHMPCPGCGSTRAAWAILRLDFAGVLRFNPVAPIVEFILVALAARVLVLVAREGTARRIDEEPLGQKLLLMLVGAVTLEIVFWALRLFGLFGGPCPV
jgi:hypothetical protein